MVTYKDGPRTERIIYDMKELSMIPGKLKLKNPIGVHGLYKMISALP